MPGHFVIPLKDLDRGPKTLDESLPLDWLEQALEGTEAIPAGEQGRLHLQLTKNGAEVLVRGRVEVEVTMPCSRTLAPMRVKLSPDVFLLLVQAPQNPGEPAPKRRRERRTQEKPGHHLAEAGKPAQRSWATDPELSDPDAARDTFSGEQVVLDEFLREFILLDLPMFPVREDLPSLPVDARATAPASAPADSVDPRLAPLLELRARMGRGKQDKE